MSTMQLSSSMTIMPPEPIMEPIAVSVVVLNRNIQLRSGDAAAGGAAGLHGLELLAVGDAAADIVNDVAEGGAHGDFHQTGVVDLAAQGEDLGAGGALAVPMEVNQSAPFRII